MPEVASASLPDAATMSQSVRSGEAQPTELVERAIRLAEEENKKLNFLAHERFDLALQEAASVPTDQPLSGVPVLTKDFSASIEGTLQSEGSWYLREFVAPADAEYIRRIKDAGAIVIGTTCGPEMAILSTTESTRFGRTKNPFDLSRSPGGSSGGSAAAVAAGVVPAAHGNDAGGSIRIPASCCELVGLKPTRGRNPLGAGLGDPTTSLWAEHVVSRTARDSALFLDVTALETVHERDDLNAEKHSFTSSLGGPHRPLKIGVGFEAPTGATVDPACVAACENVAKSLEGLGHEVVVLSPSFDAARAEQAFFPVFCASVTARLEHWAAILGRKPAEGELEPMTSQVAAMGAPGRGELTSALEVLQSESRAIARFFDEVDVWLTPTLAQPPRPLGYFDLQPGEDASSVFERDAAFSPFTWLANFTGLPAVSVPAAQDGRLPIGAHLIGRGWSEATLLQLASQLEQHRKPAAIDRRGTTKGERHE